MNKIKTFCRENIIASGEKKLVEKLPLSPNILYVILIQGVPEKNL